MANLSNILKIKDSITGEWIEIPALKGNDGKSAYEYAVEGGFTGTEAELTEALGKVADFATKTELETEKTAREEADTKLQEAIDALKEEVGDDVATKLEEINEDIEAIEEELEKKADAENVYTKEETDAKLTSVYKYKGSLATYEDLPTESLIAGDVYNIESTGDNYAWTGTEWDKLAGTIDLTDYALKTEVEAEKTAREEADTTLEGSIETEKTAREEADTKLQEAIDKLGEDAITEHNDLTGRDEEECHPISAITGLEDKLASIESDIVTNKTDITTNKESIATNKTDIADLKESLETVETNASELETKVEALETGMGDVYTKEETDAKLTSIYKYKGSVADFDSLPTADLVIGDVYNTEATGDNYAWDGTAWDKLAGTVDLTDYALKTEVETEKTAREEAIQEVEKQIEEIELTPGADGKSGVHVGSEEPAAESEANVWIDPNGVPTVSLLQIQTQLAELEERVAILEA